MNLSVPAASDPVERVADWIELQTILSASHQFSIETIVREIRRGGSTDAVEGSEGDRGSETSQKIAQDAFLEIENRIRACSNEGAYPFVVENGLIRLKDDWNKAPYSLLLFLSVTKPTSGHKGSAVLFERLCRYAALHYFGGPTNNAVALRFGSPRKSPIARFHQAIDSLCVDVGEGGGCRIPRKAKHLGDDGLDIVVWRQFPDSRQGKLIGFGQCATGDVNWSGKVSELDGTNFVKKWFRSTLVVDPVRLFFVPRRVPSDDWENVGIDAGILFDRCRIVACLPALDAELAKDCGKMISKLSKKLAPA